MKILITALACLYSVAGLGSEKNVESLKQKPLKQVTFNYTQCEGKIGTTIQVEDKEIKIARDYCNTELVNASTELAIAMNDAASNYRATKQPCENFDSQMNTAKQYITTFRSLSMGTTDTAGLADDSIVFGLFQMEDILNYTQAECNTVYLFDPTNIDLTTQTSKNSL